MPYVPLIICKSGLLIFIFAEYTHTTLNKTPLFPQSLGPLVFLSFSLSFSLSQANSLERRSPLSSLSCLGLQDPRERVPCAYVKQCKPRVKGFIGFLHKPRNISLFLSLFYFLIIDSGPPGSSTLKDPDNPVMSNSTPIVNQTQQKDPCSTHLKHP